MPGYWRGTNIFFHTKNIRVEPLASAYPADMIFSRRVFSKRIITVVIQILRLSTAVISPLKYAFSSEAFSLPHISSSLPPPVVAHTSALERHGKNVRAQQVSAVSAARANRCAENVSKCTFSPRLICSHNICRWQTTARTTNRPLRLLLINVHRRRPARVPRAVVSHTPWRR